MKNVCVTKLMRQNMKALSQFDPLEFNRDLENQCGYRDTDAFDVELYHALSSKYSLPLNRCHLIKSVNGNEIKFSADAWVGVKQLAQISNNTEEWLDLYQSIQSNLRLRLLWPSHRLPTINTSRYTYFHDRVDLLLADLQRYFVGWPTLLEKAYNNRETAIWLKLFESFSDFVQMTQLDWLFDGDRVIDLVNLKPFDMYRDLDTIRHDHNVNLMRRYVLNSIKLANE